jgi:predicted  nucleic acid-binding Zn-ribbon protein
LEKAAKANPEKDMRRNRDSYTRSIKKANRDIQRAQKKLDDARRDNDKIQTEIKLLPAEEKSAKQTLDQAKKESDQAMQAYRKTIADYQVASRQASIARSKVSGIQQEKDQATRELEGLHSKASALPSNK